MKRLGQLWKEIWERKEERWFPVLCVSAVGLFLLSAAAALVAALLFPAPSGPVNPLPDAVPDWVERDLLPVNEYSRSGAWLTGVEGVVVHYTGNPGTTAKQNRNYFAGLAGSGETYASSNFIIGLEGEVLLCVPVNEVAYASGARNEETISIEVCHPGEDGVFTPAAYDSLVRLVQWLVDTYGLEREDILRHYDITGKQCPRWFVEDQEAWEDFLDRIVFE